MFCTCVILRAQIIYSLVSVGRVCNLTYVKALWYHFWSDDVTSVTDRSTLLDYEQYGARTWAQLSGACSRSPNNTHPHMHMAYSYPLLEESVEVPRQGCFANGSCGSATILDVEIVLMVCPPEVKDCWCTSLDPSIRDWLWQLWCPWILWHRGMHSGIHPWIAGFSAEKKK